MNEFLKKINSLIKNKIFFKTAWNYFVYKVMVNLNFLRYEPKFLIIGAAKSGTTYAFNLLRQHPQLNLPKEKEINFFDYNFNKGTKWYRYQFPFKTKIEKISGEGSPCYMYHPHAPKRAFSYNPNFKLVIFLRNPSYRAVSNYFMKMNFYNFEFNPERLLFIEEEINLGNLYEKNIIENENSSHKILRDFSFIRRGIYLFQIKRWYQYFPKENFLIIKSEDFYENPIKVLDQICDFLKIERYNGFNLKVDKYQGNYKNRVDEKIISTLKDFYKPHNEELEEYLNRKFNWE